MRIALTLIGLIGVFFLPPWVPLICIILLSLRYRAWEVAVLGALTDLIWLPGGSSIHLVPFFTIISLIIVWGLEPLRVQFLR